MPYCQHCGDYFEEMKEKTKHTKSCLQNPKIITRLEQAHFESKDEVNLREMLSRIYTYDDIFTEVDTFLLDKGLTVEWTSRPSRFNSTIPASYFGQPTINRNPDKIYAGWEGDFSGQLYKLDGTKAEESFWDLNGSMSGKWNLSFLKSGGGSWGDNFGGSGTLFFADFPNIYKEFHNQGFDDRYNVLINKQIDNIVNEVQIQQSNMIAADKTLHSITYIEDKINAIRIKIGKAKGLHLKFIKDKFQSEVTVSLPKIEMPFVNMDAYNSFTTRYKKPIKEKDPAIDISAYTEELLELQTKAEEYCRDYAEYFI